MTEPKPESTTESLAEPRFAALRPARPEDDPTIQRLCLQYAPLAHGFPTDLPGWRAQFRENPSGPDRGWVLADEEDRVVGHITTMPLPFDWAGEIIPCGKNESAVTLEEFQAAKAIGPDGRTRRAPAALVTAMTQAALDSGLSFVFSTGVLTVHWLYAQCGYKRIPLKRRFVLLPLGLSIGLAGWIGDKLGLPLKTLPGWLFQAAELALLTFKKMGRKKGGLTLDPVNQFDRRQVRLWELIKKEAGVTHSLARDPDTFNWRFNKPKYGCYWIRHKDELAPIGYLIACLEPEPARRTIKVVDLIIRPAWLNQIGSIIDQLVARPRYAKAQALVIDNYIVGQYSADLAEALAGLTVLGRKGAAERETVMSFHFGELPAPSESDRTGWLINTLFMQYF